MFVAFHRQILGGMLGSAILKDGNPLTLHYVMFIPAIMGQGTVEQQGYWISKAWSCNIIGTYAQTELGHGTFIRGLETAATYDPETKEFILNSPTLTSYKWWPGGCKHYLLNILISANRARVLYNRLMKEKCFQWVIRRIMQLSLRNYTRKESAEVSILLLCNLGMRILTSLYRVCSHKYTLFCDENLYILSLSPVLFKLIAKFIYEIFVFVLGIKIGEIGTKLGMNASNNGFLGFENVRIPRENMLMKNSQVLEDGTYVKAPSDKLTYGTMMFVRVVLVRDISNYLSKAVTIAIRYSAVRRQSQIKSDEPEAQIIDYVTQQYKLFPNLAACFAFRMCADWIWEMYNNVTAELDQGELERLPELHALACCLKAVASSDGATGIEQLRLACGGHGYMDASNLPGTYGLVTAVCTYEGENTVLLLQTARYLVKAWRQAVGGQPLPPTVGYLIVISRGIKQRPWKNTLTCIVQAHQAVAAG
ncbi:hypothetical protein ACFW04_010310 [Cataglyphis niger]